MTHDRREDAVKARLRTVVRDQHERHGLETPPYGLCRVAFFDDRRRGPAYGASAWPYLAGGNGHLRYHLNVALDGTWWETVWDQKAAVVDGTFVLHIEGRRQDLVAAHVRWRRLGPGWSPGQYDGVVGTVAHSKLVGRPGAWSLVDRVIGRAASAGADYLLEVGVVGVK